MQWHRPSTNAVKSPTNVLCVSLTLKWMKARACLCNEMCRACGIMGVTKGRSDGVCNRADDSSSGVPPLFKKKPAANLIPLLSNLAIHLSVQHRLFLCLYLRVSFCPCSYPSTLLFYIIQRSIHFHFVLLSIWSFFGHPCLCTSL